MKNPAKAWLIVSLDCLCTDVQSHMTWTATNPQQNILKILPSVSAVPESMHLCWSNHLSCSVSPGDHKWIDVAVLFSTPSCSQVFQICSRPRPTLWDSPSHAAMINPSCSHLYHLMLLCVWFMSAAEDWTKGHSLPQQRDRHKGGKKGGVGGGALVRRKCWWRKLSNAVSDLSFCWDS